MKYLLVEDIEQEEQTLLNNIAEFFWNNGNEVYNRNNFNKKADHQFIAEFCNCVVFLIHKDCSTESFFDSKQEMFSKDLDLKKGLNKKLVLVFTINGVYSNAIPSPYKIFHFESLCQDELSRFFRWCEKLNLFIKKTPYAANHNFLFL